MALVINLTPNEEARLQHAAQQSGIAPAELARKIVSANLPLIQATQTPKDPTLALFEQWLTEDAQVTAEQKEQESLIWEQFEAGINETRKTLGMRLL